MKVEELGLPGVLLLHADAFPDERGLFCEVFRESRYAELGIGGFVQDNHSRSRRGVVRGLHFQLRHPQAKLLTVLRGEIFDVVVDIRVGSPTFGQHVTAVLSGGSGRQLWVPPGYAHGFCALEDSDVLYKCTDVWHADDSRGVRWDDPLLAIPWPIAEPVMSGADRRLPGLAELVADDLPGWP
ncbi:MAG TPA: dTDP-4-dehydrorhamnose 3,5-epimerase [Myxococcota bacterium]|nr:dTDP-4-dehydrorhamnose 3,5-epimerase [Myxococcota bacterium]